MRFASVKQISTGSFPTNIFFECDVTTLLTNYFRIFLKTETRSGHISYYYIERMRNYHDKKDSQIE